MKPHLLATTLSIFLLAATSANATLIASDYGKTLFDDDLNIYWLADANYAKTSGFSGDIEGKMTWSQAQAWITSLNTSQYLGYSNWRLPSTTDTGTPGCNTSFNGTTDCGYNAIGSEMSHLFFSELGNKALFNTSGITQSGSGLVNTGLFTNFYAGDYWSGTEYAPTNRYAWTFDMSLGKQYKQDEIFKLYAMAVRDGQVATVPVPAAAWLLGSGLLGLLGLSRRKTA